MIFWPVPQIAAPLKPGDTVRTPGGREAKLIAIFPEEGEGLVLWANRESARFRLKLLQPVPEKA